CQRPKQTIRAEEPKLNVPGTHRNETCKHDATGTRVRRCLWIGDHEKRKEQQRAVFDSMYRYQKWLTEPDGSAQQEPDCTDKKSEAHVATSGAVDNHTTKTSHEECEDRSIPPLTGRYPHLISEQNHRDNSEVRRIEQMLAVDTDHKFARD